MYTVVDGSVSLRDELKVYALKKTNNNLLLLMCATFDFECIYIKCLRLFQMF